MQDQRDEEQRRAELGRIREMNATALVLAGLTPALVLPTVAAALLGEAKEDTTTAERISA